MSDCERVVCSGCKQLRIKEYVEKYGICIVCKTEVKGIIILQPKKGEIK